MCQRAECLIGHGLDSFVEREDTGDLARLLVGRTVSRDPVAHEAPLLGVDSDLTAVCLLRTTLLRAEVALEAAERLERHVTRGSAIAPRVETNTPAFRRDLAATRCWGGVSDGSLARIGEKHARDLASPVRFGFLPRGTRCCALGVKRALVLVVPRGVLEEHLDGRWRVVDRRRVNRPDALIAVHLEARAKLEARDALRVDMDKVQAGNRNNDSELLMCVSVAAGDERRLPSCFR